MPDLKKTIAFFEGDDDKAFLEQLQQAGLLPLGWQLAIRDKNQHPGKEGLVRQLMPVVSPVNGIDGRAVVLVDLDDLTPVERAEWFRAAVEEALRKDSRYADVALHRVEVKGRVHAMRLDCRGRVGCIAVVPVGHPGDADLNERYQIDRHAIDDWVFRLALNQAVFESMAELRGIGYEIAVRKYVEVATLFRQNGLEVRKAKTYVQILRALAAIGPSTATIVGRLVKKGVEVLGKETFMDLMRPFLDDLTDAEDLLNASRA